MPVNLKNFTLFEGVPDADLRPLAERAVTRTFPKQAIIINEGDIGDSLFMVVSGRVKVYLSDEHGKELILSIKGPGNYFGELALDENLRSASVMTLEPSQFAVLPRAEFKTFVDQGGYQKRQYWNQEFRKDGRVLSWSEGMALLSDATGRPGPDGSVVHALLWKPAVGQHARPPESQGQASYATDR